MTDPVGVPALITSGHAVMGVDSHKHVHGEAVTDVIGGILALGIVVLRTALNNA